MTTKEKKPVPKLRKTRIDAGSKRADYRLSQLEFDPIEKLVMVFNKIDTEIARQEQRRDGTLVELTHTGKVRPYVPEQHFALFDRQINIGEKLLRYRYGRVPEGIANGDKRPGTLVVQLTKKGDEYVINGEPSELPDTHQFMDEPEDAEWDEMDEDNDD